MGSIRKEKPHQKLVVLAKVQKEAEKTLKKHRPNYTEKQNGNDNTTKETYNMEKIEVDQGLLASLLELAQKCT